MRKAMAGAAMFVALCVVRIPGDAATGKISLRPLQDLSLAVYDFQILMSPSGNEAIVERKDSEFFYVISLNADGTGMECVVMPFPEAKWGHNDGSSERRAEWGEDDSLRFWKGRQEVLVLSAADRRRPVFTDRSTSDSVKQEAFRRYCVQESNKPPATHFEDEDGNWMRPSKCILRMKVPRPPKLTAGNITLMLLGMMRMPDPTRPEPVIGVEGLFLVEGAKRTAIVQSESVAATGFSYDPAKRRVCVQRGPGGDFIYVIDTGERIALPGDGPEGKSYMEYLLIPGRDFLFGCGMPRGDGDWSEFDFYVYLCDLRGKILESIPLGRGWEPWEIACSNRMVIVGPGPKAPPVVRVLKVEETP